MGILPPPSCIHVLPGHSAPSVNPGVDDVPPGRGLESAACARGRRGHARPRVVPTQVAVLNAPGVKEGMCGVASERERGILLQPVWRRASLPLHAEMTAGRVFHMVCPPRSRCLTGSPLGSGPHAVHGVWGTLWFRSPGSHIQVCAEKAGQTARDVYQVRGGRDAAEQCRPQCGTQPYIWHQIDLSFRKPLNY